MKLPNNVTIQTYKSVTEMSPDLHAKVKMMGHAMDTGHMRELARGKNHTLVSCAVLFYKDKPVGWTAYYYPNCKSRYEAHKEDRRPSVSVWIAKNMRGKGLGRILTDFAYNRWRRYDPETYNSVYHKWWDKNKGYDNTHKARVATLKRKGKISPNASVTDTAHSTITVRFDEDWF